MTGLHRNSNPKAEFRVRLECGHTSWLRSPPMGDKVKFGCNAGLGCGYRLWWVEAWSVTDPSRKEINYAYRAMKKKEGDTA